jgi:hypothetical protein
LKPYGSLRVCFSIHDVPTMKSPAKLFTSVIEPLPGSSHMAYGEGACLTVFGLLFYLYEHDGDAVPARMSRTVGRTILQGDCAKLA